jgi:hypothetical protein
MAPHLGDQDWRSLAEQVAKEMDPAKLTILIAKLCLALDSERKENFSVAEPLSAVIATDCVPQHSWPDNCGFSHSLQNRSSGLFQNCAIVTSRAVP